MPTFALNVSILLKEYPFVDRFAHAARLGFGQVEFWWPRGEDLAAVRRAVGGAGLGVALINFDAGDMPAGDRGLLSDPARLAELTSNVPKALDLAVSLGCTRMNALVGRLVPAESRESQLTRVTENLAWVAEQARAAGVTVMLEALNPFENPGYLLNTTRDVLDLMARVKAPNVGYQYDVYHLQRSEGNIVATLREHLAKIGHIQIADSPGRHQPGTGELNFAFILEAIESAGYAGAIGLEYNPLGSSEESLDWLPPARRKR